MVRPSGPPFQTWRADSLGKIGNLLEDRNHGVLLAGCSLLTTLLEAGVNLRATRATKWRRSVDGLIFMAGMGESWGVDGVDHGFLLWICNDLPPFPGGFKIEIPGVCWPKTRFLLG